MTLEEYRAMLHGIEGYLDAYGSAELEEVRRYTLAVNEVLAQAGVDEQIRDSLFLLLCEALDARVKHGFVRGWNSAGEVSA